MDKNEVLQIRKDFPYFEVNGGRIIYFDNAATTQKPRQVIERLNKYYYYENGNPHRGAHYLAMKATEVYENARSYIAKFLNASSPNEIVFVRNASEALNLLSYSYGNEILTADDEVLISIMEHHSNLVPWQQVVKKTGAKLKYLYIDKDMQITEEEFKTKLTKNTKVFSITAASNVVSTIPSIEKMIKYIRENYPDVIVILDASQYIPHRKINVQKIGCDFLVFSGHKLCSPMGIGVLYGKEKLLNKLKPFLTGGDMIEYVYEDKTTFLDAPQRFEAGTQNVGGAVSLESAIKYLENIGFDKIYEHETMLTNYAFDKMLEIPYIDVYSTKNKMRTPVISFNFKQVHPHDVASILDTKGIAVRSGHHCAQPLHRFLGINFSCRVSFAFYNTIEEVDKFIESLSYVKEVMKI